MPFSADCLKRTQIFTITLRKGHCPAVNINQTLIPQAESVKYLGLQFYRRLTWKDHTAMKKKTNQLKYERDQLANREKIPSICRKQSTNLQSDNQTYLELRNGTVWLR
jgi:hypothetical protein